MNPLEQFQHNVSSAIGLSIIAGEMRTTLNNVNVHADIEAFVVLTDEQRERLFKAIGMQIPIDVRVTINIQAYGNSFAE